MINKEHARKVYYFSQQLKKKLAEIANYPVTVVEAPSGFGKTTAIKEYLKENLPDGAYEYWYTCMGEPVSMSWRGICELLAHVNIEIAANLNKLEMPTMETLLHITAILRDFKCQAEAYLVIDNYQLVESDIPRELINVFATHGSPNLHIIFITQQIRSKQRFTMHNAEINTIDSTAFFFDREGTSSLFRMEGIRLTAEELESVFRCTEGWVSAIRLQIINYKEMGTFDNSADIEHLVELAIWKRLSQEEKDFLLSISVLESFTPRQAAVMMGKDVLPENIEELLKTNDFIRYYPEKNSYAIHSILQDYLRSRFFHHQPKEFQNKMLRLAGHSYAMTSQYYLAGQFFLQVGDFDIILSMPLDGKDLAEQKENNILAFIASVVNECPEETMMKYPFVMLTYAYLMLMDGQMENFEKLCRMIETVALSGGDLTPEKLRRFKGEFALLTVYITYNNITEMTRGIKEALQILNGPSSIIINCIPWTFGGVSALSMFWRESGCLEKEMHELEECLPDYLKLTRKHCAGMNSAMRAEAMLMRGADDEAEIMCYKALYEARSNKQVGVCLCAEKILAQIAVLRGDADGYTNAVSNIHGYSKETPCLNVLRLEEYCISELNLMLGIKENVAQWLYDTESIKKVLYPHFSVFAMLLYAKLLILEKRYREFFALSHHLKDSAWNTTGNICYMMLQLNQLLYLSSAKHNCGNDAQAQEHFREALCLALPDRILLPIAQQEGLLDSLLKPACIPSLAKVLPGEDVSACLTVLKALCKRYEKGAAAVRKAVLQTKSPLTPREREIAQLAKERFSAKEIADKLYISETTVRTILRNVYSKLDVHSKTELNARDF